MEFENSCIDQSGDQMIIKGVPPLSWFGYEPKTDIGAPAVESMDNPGSWNLFLFFMQNMEQKRKARKA